MVRGFVSAPPSSLDLHGTHPQRKKLAAPEMNLSLDQSEGSILSDDALDTPDDLDINVDDMDTPDEADSLDYAGHGTEQEWQGEKHIQSIQAGKVEIYSFLNNRCSISLHYPGELISSILKYSKTPGSCNLE